MVIIYINGGPMDFDVRHMLRGHPPQKVRDPVGIPINQRPSNHLFNAPPFCDILAMGLVVVGVQQIANLPPNEVVRYLQFH